MTSQSFVLRPVVLSISLLLPFGLFAQDEVGSDKTWEEVIPITAANIRGQKALYNEGWFVISSTEDAFRYAKEKSLLSTGQALKKTLSQLKQNSAEYTDELAESVGKGLKTGGMILKGGTQLSGAALMETHALAQWQLEVAQQGFVSAWDAFVLGNISLAQRTEADRVALKNIPGDYFSTINDDFSNIWQLTKSVGDALSPDIEVGWGASFAQAREAFVDEYEASGEASNSLSALGNIGFGYLQALYHGLIKPSSKAAAKGVTVTARVAGQTIFLPTASLFIVTGRTVQSAGLTLYYTTKTGVKVVSPTVESGLLAGVSLLSAAAMPVTYAAGATVGVVNQVAVTTAAPLAGTVHAAAGVAEGSLKYAGLMTYDLVKGTSKVVINQASSGVALGYNALTALPAHMLLGGANAAFFLVYDGPRLLIAKVSGELDGGQTPENLPVGTVMDLKKLSSSASIQVETVSDDPVIIERVLRQMPKDLRQ